MNTHITEMIPDDRPQWMNDAMNRGQLFNEVIAKVKDLKDKNIRLS